MNLPEYSLRNARVIGFFLFLLLVGGMAGFATLGKKEDSTFVIKSAMLLCSRDHLYKLDRLGKLKKYRESVRFVYWLRDEVEAYAKGQTVTSAGEGEAVC